MPQWATFSQFLDQTRAAAPADRPALVTSLFADHPAFPWIDSGSATFVYRDNNAHSVALNLDTIPDDPPFAAMERLEGTDLWFITRAFADDDLLDYLIAVDDPMTPLRNETALADRIGAHWRPDPANPIRMESLPLNVSVLRMPNARPFPDWSAFRVPHGTMTEQTLRSAALGVESRSVWVYTPPGYNKTTEIDPLPLLILHDGQWMTRQFQVAAIADTLIRHERMPRAILAMVQSGVVDTRDREYAASDAHYHFLTNELLPMLQTDYPVDPARIGVGGVAIGAIAAMDAALRSPTVFRSLIAISPPLGKGAHEAALRSVASQFETAEALPARVFQSVGRYESRGRFVRPALALRETLTRRVGGGYQFVETGSGHGLVAFRAVLPEALAWALQS